MNFEVLKRIRQFYSFNGWLHKTHFFLFFNFYVFVNNKTTVIARRLIFSRKYRQFNSLSNAIHPIQIHKAVLEKLQFKKKSEKNFNLRNLRINPFAQRTHPIRIQNLPIERISKWLIQFIQLSNDIKNHFFFINYFASS